MGVSCFFFFFRQKTAYERLMRFVGSEMCIRDSPRAEVGMKVAGMNAFSRRNRHQTEKPNHARPTSSAAQAGTSMPNNSSGNPLDIFPAEMSMRTKEAKATGNTAAVREKSIKTP